MKMTLAALLFLIVGCNQAQSSDSMKPPVACPLVFYFPITTLRLDHLNPDLRYQVLIQKKILWDECSRSSEYHSTTVTQGSYQEPDGSTNHTLTIETIDFLGNDENINIQVFGLDEKCSASPLPFIEKDVKFETETYNKADTCTTRPARYRYSIDLK